RDETVTIFCPSFSVCGSTTTRSGRLGANERRADPGPGLQDFSVPVRRDVPDLNMGFASLIETVRIGPAGDVGIPVAQRRGAEFSTIANGEKETRPS